MTERMGGIAVVTGAASGMGLASARRLAPLVDEVIVVDLDADRTAPIATELGATPFACDVTDAARVAALADFARTRGRVRAIVHAAGISPTMAAPERIVDVDLRGTALVLQAFDAQVTPGMVAVCFASIAAAAVAGAGDPAIDAVLDEPLADDLLERLAAFGSTVLGDPGAYGWSKRAVQRLVRRTAVAWGPRGGRIVSISPGMIDTPMGAQEAAAQPTMAFMLEHTPLGREGTADELAAVVEFLCSDAASFVTGVDLTVDGGVMAGLERFA